MSRFCLLLLTVIFALTGCANRGDSPLPGEPSAFPPSQASPVSKTESPAEPTDEPSPAQSSAENVPLTSRITVPEGYTLPRIGMTLEDMGVCTAQEFIAAAQDGDFSGFSLVAAQSDNPNRCYRLEGYLFPDTYEFYTQDSPDTIIRTILTHTEQMITPQLRQDIERSGYTVDEILTMASIIEKEALGRTQMPLISSVLHNRLDAGMRLQCDVTIIYVTGAIDPFVEGGSALYAEYYNTYKCNGLPAGAICNPGIDAIRAALSPAQSDYFFFVTDHSGNYYYSESYEEHLENVAMVEELNKAGEASQ